MGMLSRCYNKSQPNYKFYGARGVTVCEKWRENFTEFLRDMQETYAENLCIDRIDPFGHYTPANTRWVTQTESRQNTRRSKKDPSRSRGL
jgi:hypothetical protein